MIRFALSICALAILVASYDDCPNSWECKLENECPWVFSGFQHGLKPMACGFSRRSVLVCCPPAPARVDQPKSTIREKCQEVRKRFQRKVLLGVVGGRDVVTKNYPHMALLGFGKNADSVQWSCGGSLISEDYVLTAAHCTAGPRGVPMWVKLGDLRMRSESQTAQYFRVLTNIAHPDYKPKQAYHDLALLRLERKAGITKDVHPICLMDHPNLPSRAIATGWGHTEFGGAPSDQLQEVDLDILDASRCKSFYNSSKFLPQGFKEEIQICAGGVGKDTCQGDSGGPLHVRYGSDNNLLQAGIVSLGKGCGIGPAIYTRILPYIKWIETTVWPQHEEFEFDSYESFDDYDSYFI